MAIRRIRKDEKGFYFKGEGFRFRHNVLSVLAQTGGIVVVTSVSCGQASALARFQFGKKVLSAIPDP